MDQRLLEKNILVFDVGNVLVRFDRRLIADGFGLSPELESAVFDTGLWDWIDSGLIGTGELARLMCRTVPGAGEREYLAICRVLDGFYTQMSALPPAGWLPELKKMGKKLYYLTNYSTPAFERTKEAFPFFSLFDGGVVSSHERMVKPMPAIYRLLCARYGFAPQDALFIDDNPNNIRAAAREGFSVWQWQG